MQANVWCIEIFVTLNHLSHLLFNFDRFTIPKPRTALTPINVDVISGTYSINVTLLSVNYLINNQVIFQLRIGGMFYYSCAVPFL